MTKMDRIMQLSRSKIKVTHFDTGYEISEKGKIIVYLYMMCFRVKRRLAPKYKPAAL